MRVWWRMILREWERRIRVRGGRTELREWEKRIRVRWRKDGIEGIGGENTCVWRTELRECEKNTCVVREIEDIGGERTCAVEEGRY